MSANQHDDLFTAMAAGLAAEPRPEMEPVPAPELPERLLPVSGNSGVSRPAPHDKLDSAVKLAARVAELRRHYEPFLRDRRPPLPRPRPTTPLTQFRFRREDAEDRRDAGRPYTEVGAWETVDIPHYGGPVGPWAAYYRTTFRVGPDLLAPGRVWLRFKGVDYIATVFVNGTLAGRHEGFFAPFSFDITDLLRQDGEQTLLVRVENDAIQMGINSWRPWPGFGQPVPEAYQLDGDKVYGGTGQGWSAPEGWTHCPPGAGIWQPVWLEACPAVSIHDLFVRPLPEQGKAELWLETWCAGAGRQPTSVELTVLPNNFAGEPQELGRHELKPAGPKVSVYKIPFEMPGFRSWTLNQPFLYTLRVSLRCGAEGATTEDAQDVTFGMRSFVQDTTASRRGAFYLNGEPIVLRGTNEMGNLSVPIQQGDRERAIGDLLIGKAAHLNYWRITQRPVQPEVYELCDRLGVLFQTDLPMFAGLRYSCIEETARQAGEMERLVRSHPGAVVSSFVNEPFPAAWHPDKVHRLVDRPTLEQFLEVCIRYTRLNNPDRVIKCLDGDYDPPPRHGMLDLHAYACMHEDHGVEVGKLHRGELFAIKQGWRCGVGEYGAEGLEPLAAMRRHYPKEWLPDRDDDPAWTPDRIPMCQAWGWHHMWYDRQDGIRAWIAATHRHQAWAVRFMHEAFRRRADIINSTAIHLLINAWPNNWLKSLCSFEREPLPAFFAFADANTPLAVNLRTDRHAVTGGDRLEADLWLLNDRPDEPQGLRVVYGVRVDGVEAFIDGCAAAVPAVSAAFQGRISWAVPTVEAPTPLTVHASLLDRAGTVLHDCALAITVLPAANFVVLSGRTVAILGEIDGRAWRLAAAFGATPRAWSVDMGPCDLVIADTAAAAAAAGEALTAFVAAGGSLLGLAQPPEAVWRIGGEAVEVRRLSGHQFVSRRTGHPVVDGFDPQHFSLWYDADRHRIAHLVDAGLQGKALRPITLTGTGIWYSRREEIPAGAEMRLGRGRMIFDQVRAPERWPGEPRAAQYLQRLLDYAARPIPAVPV